MYNLGKDELLIQSHYGKKVILFIPNSRWFGKRQWLMVHQAALILTAILKGEFDFAILDANGRNLSEEKCRLELERFGPDIVLVSALSVEYHRHYHAAAHLARTACPQSLIIMGGVYPTVLLEEAGKDTNIDYFFMGHAEQRINEFLQIIMTGDKDRIHRFDGIAYRNGCGELNVNPVTSYIGDVGKLVQPDYSLTDLTPYLRQETLDYQYNSKGKSGYIITSYGCPYNCCFCATRTISGRRVTMRPVEDVMEEIDYLVQTYNITELSFQDDCLLLDRRRINAILNGLIERNYGLTWKAVTVCAWHLERELLELMKKSGCTQVTISVESGCQRVLREIIHKPLKLEIIPDVVRNCKEVGINLGANFVIGFPGETWDEIRQTFHFAKSQDFDVTHFHIATPLPKTDLYKIAKDNNMLAPNFSFTDESFFGFGNAFIATEEFTPTELLVLRAYEWDRINFSSPEKTAKVVEMYHTSSERLREHRKQTRLKCGVYFEKL